MQTSLAFWVGFNAVVLILLTLDLTVLHREARAISIKESLITTLAWIVLAIGFGLWIIRQEGTTKGLEFFTGYLIEYALSLDNIFIFVLVFTAFKVDAERQHRLLFWGVMGALVMRGAMIGAGVALLNAFSWIIYVFGAYILYAGFQMLFHKADENAKVEEQFVVRMARRFLPLSSGEHGGRFIVREAGKYKFTLMFLVLVIVELTDLIFALDSIPAIFGVTKDPFIVYTSNVCAILGLRSLYFLLAGAVKSLVYLHTGLACVLIFIGGKMVGEHFLHVPTGLSLLIVGGILAISITASLIKTKGSRQSPVDAMTAAPGTLTQRHYDCLDGLRAVLALYVVMHHAWLGVFLEHPVELNPGFLVLALGRYAVCFFIVLSGFCLMLPTLENGFRQAKGMGSFIQRRAWRILPPYYFALILSVLVDLPVNHRMSGPGWDMILPVTRDNIRSHLLLIHNFIPDDIYKINGAFWSIPIEWQIYFVFPLLLLGWRWMGPLLATVTAMVISLPLERELTCIMAWRLASILSDSLRWGWRRHTSVRPRNGARPGAGSLSLLRQLSRPPSSWGTRSFRIWRSAFWRLRCWW